MTISHITNTNIPVIHITDTNQTIAPTKIYEIAHEILQLLANIERRLTIIENKQTELYTKVEQIRSAPPPPPPPPPPKTHEESNEPSMPRKEREPNNTPTNKTSPNPQAVGVAGQLSEIFKESNNNLQLEDKTFLPTSIRRAQSLRIKPKQSSNADEDNKLSTKIKKYPPSPPSATSSLPKTHVENNESFTPKKESTTDIPILKEKPSNSQVKVLREASEGLIAEISSESASILKDKTDVSTNSFQRKQPCYIKLLQKETNEVDPKQTSFAAKRQIFEGVKP